MAFAIGTFDGVHLGHQAVLSKLRSYGVPTCVLTFPAHPLKVLRPTEVPAAILPLSVKLLLLKTDYCLLLEFTDQLASMTYQDLLDRLPLSHLVLGKNDAFGKSRQGTEPAVRTWAEKNRICVDTLDKLPDISSTAIRKAIQTGDLATAEKLLGRPHLLLAPSNRFFAHDLILPPNGTYPLKNNTAFIKDQLVELANPITKPTLFSFNPNEEPHVF